MPVKAKFTPGPALASLEALHRQHVVVGVLGSNAAAGHGPGATNVDVATWMEFGTETRDGKVHVHARSFLRATIRTKKADISTFVRGRVKLVASGKLTAAQAYEQIGLRVRAMVQATIRAGIAPPLKVRDGVPLINTGQLIGSITPEVRSR